jgi:recombination protein RecA
MAKQKKENVKGNIHKEEDMQKVVAAMRKEYGDNSIARMGDVVAVKDIEVISTGSLLLDQATGIGGFPKGRIVEIYGPSGGGKTTVTLHVISAAQKAGGHAMFVDAEHALDIALAKKVGVDVDDLYFSQPDSGEQALGLVEFATLSAKFAVIVVDSVSALTPRAEIEGEMGDSHMGLQARLMSQAMRKLSGIVAKSNTLVIFINQIRQKIGVTWGNNETTTGGNALKFYSSMRVDIRRIGAVKHGDLEVGNKVKIKVVKNKLAPPFKVIETELIFGRGLHKEGEVMDMAHDLDVVDVKGNAWYYRESLMGKSKHATATFLRENPNIFDSILADVQIANGAP